MLLWNTRVVMWMILKGANPDMITIACLISNRVCAISTGANLA